MDGQRQSYPLAVMCQALGVTRAGYYAWPKRKEAPPGPRAVRRAGLAREIRAAHRESRGTYGSPRVYHRLKAEGVAVCENTVAKVMREESIRSKVRRRFIGAVPRRAGHGAEAAAAGPGADPSRLD